MIYYLFLANHHFFQQLQYSNNNQIFHYLYLQLKQYLPKEDYNILKNIEMRGHIDSLEYNNTLYQIERIKKEEDEICEKISSQIEDKDKLCEFCAHISGIAISEIDDINLVFRDDLKDLVNNINTFGEGDQCFIRNIQFSKRSNILV